MIRIIGAAEPSAAPYCNIYSFSWYLCAEDDIMKELSKVDFTIEQYIKSPEDVLEKAMSFVSSLSMTKQDVCCYLEGKCRQMILDSFTWDISVDPIVEEGFLRGMVDGCKVVFFVKVSPRYMKVSLLKRGKLFEKEAQLDPDSSAIFTETPYLASPISEYGLQKAKSLAAELYYWK